MPLFDVRCAECHNVREELLKADEAVPPCECGGERKKLIVPARPILFREGWYEHIDTKPVYVRTKKQLRDECRKRGLTSIYAEEG